MTSVSDIVDHTLVGLIAAAGLAIPVILSQRRSHARIQEVHEELNPGNGDSKLSRIETEIVEIKHEQGRMMSVLAQHIVEPHVHAVTGQATSLPVKKTSGPGQARVRESKLEKELAEKVEVLLERREQVQGQDGGSGLHPSRLPPIQPSKKKKPPSRIRAATPQKRPSRPRRSDGDDPGGG